MAKNGSCEGSAQGNGDPWGGQQPFPLNPKGCRFSFIKHASLITAKHEGSRKDAYMKSGKSNKIPVW